MADITASALAHDSSLRKIWKTTTPKQAACSRAVGEISALNYFRQAGWQIFDAWAVVMPYCRYRDIFVDSTHVNCMMNQAVNQQLFQLLCKT